MQFRQMHRGTRNFLRALKMFPVAAPRGRYSSTDRSPEILSAINSFISSACEWLFFMYRKQQACQLFNEVGKLIKLKLPGVGFFIGDLTHTSTVQSNIDTGPARPEDVRMACDALLSWHVRAPSKRVECNSSHSDLCRLGSARPCLLLARAYRSSLLILQYHGENLIRCVYYVLSQAASRPSVCRFAGAPANR